MNIYNTNKIIRQCISEFFGTGLIVFFGLGATMSSKLTSFHLNYWDISFIWGISVALSIYLSSSISGAHLNPAITIFLWLSSNFNKKKVLPYIISQISGSFFCTMIIYYFYNQLFLVFEQTHKIIRGTQESIQLASIFCLYPNSKTSFLYDFILEIIICFIFMILLMALNDKKKYSSYYNTSITPLLIGMLVLVINISVGASNNLALNPANDLGPRIFLSIIGWGTLAFTGGANNISYFLIPIFGPIIGINLGGWIYNKIFFYID